MTEIQPKQEVGTTVMEEMSECVQSLGEIDPTAQARVIRGVAW